MACPMWLRMLTRRSFVELSVAALLLGGCRSPSPGHWPWSQTGTTRIPPPPTGAFGMADSGAASASASVSASSSRLAAADRPGSENANTRSSVANADDRRGGQLGTGPARLDRVATRTDQPAGGLDEPLQWIDPAKRTGADTLPSPVRRSTSILAPSPAIREPTPPAGGKTVIRLSYEQPEEDRTGMEILTPTSPWMNRSSLDTSVR